MDYGTTESLPLLRGFENESFRSKMRKRCMRIPSEVAVTSVILGLFVIVVTLIIVLENYENTEENELQLSPSLLASPFKYNKKPLDKSWQEKKETMKEKNMKERKWDNINKGWKQVPYSSEDGIDWNDFVNPAFAAAKSNQHLLKMPMTPEEYGKEIEDSLEDLLKENKVTEEENQEEPKNYKWKKVNEGWKRVSKPGEKEKYKKERKSKSGTDSEKTRDEYKIPHTLVMATSQNKGQDKKEDAWERLSKQGWGVKELNKALYHSWMESTDAEKTPENYQNLWESFKDTLDGSVDNDAGESEQNSNDEWKNDMKILTSSKAYTKKQMKLDEGWKKLSEQGWKNKEIERALFEALKEKENGGLIESSTDSQSLDSSSKPPSNGMTEGIKDFFHKIWKRKESVMQSPVNFNHLWLKGGEILRQLLEREGPRKTQSSMGYGGSASVYQPSNMLYRNQFFKKLIRQGWTGQEIKQALNEAWKEKYKSLSTTKS